MTIGIPVLSVDHNGSAPWPEDVEARLEKLQAFIFGACNAEANWNMENFIRVFEDEVRECGLALGLPRSMVFRQPFPGPGLGVHCIGAITRDRLEAVGESDAILREEFAKARLEGKVWQYFSVVPDVKSVVVRDHKRSFEWPVVLRAVNTVDAMTATVERVPYEVLEIITQSITHEVKGANRLLYDLTPKPAGIIECE